MGPWQFLNLSEQVRKAILLWKYPVVNSLLTAGGLVCSRGQGRGVLQEGCSRRKGSPQGEQKFSVSGRSSLAGMQRGWLEGRVRRWARPSGAWELARLWPGTRALSPEPRACQSWPQVLGRIRKAPSVSAPQPGSGLHSIPGRYQPVNLVSFLKEPNSFKKE